MKPLNLKKIAIYMSSILMLASCRSAYQTIGSVDMLSSKTLDTTLNYKQYTVNTGASRKQIKHSTAENIDQAINNVVSQVPGGMYITNVTIYIVKGDYYAVSGNVWGVQKDTLIIHHYAVASASTERLSSSGTRKP